MPTLKILVGDKLVDAEIVVRDGALFAKVPDEYIGSSMPLLTAKLQAQVEVVGMLLNVGDFVHAAEESFRKHYGQEGMERARALTTEYQLCREIYDAGKYDVAKQKLSSLEGHIQCEMVSFELAKMVKDELKAHPESSKKVKVVKKNGQEVFTMAAHFDGARLEAKLFGAAPAEPVGELLDLPAGMIPSTMSLEILGGCSCDCLVPPAPLPKSVGWLETVRRWVYGSLACQAQESYGSQTTKSEPTACSIYGTQGTKCERIRLWYYAAGSS